MRKLSFLLSLLITSGLIFVLNNSFHTSSIAIPAIGKFFNPINGFWKNAEPINEIRDSPTIESVNLSGEVKVVFDDRLIPHIFAENAADAYFTQGFITAQNRLWQMDFMTRDVTGRISELVGKKALKRDKYKRRIGLQYAAEKALEVWKKNPEAYKLAEAYANGVNAYIESLEEKDYPLEFKLLDYAPEKWTPLHSALVTKAMAESLCLRARDIKATNAKAFFADSTFQFLYPEYFSEQLPIIPKEVTFDFEKIKSTDQKGVVHDYLGDLEMEFSNENLGSNNWAIAGEKSVSGNAILAGDPHLMLTLPSIWYEVQIHTPEMNAYGVSLPGVPGIAIGFNDDIAWSMTNTGHDVADFYELEWNDSTKQRYLLDSQWVKVQKRVEHFAVKDGFGNGNIVDTVRYTYWGPVVTENKDSIADLAFRWMAHDDPMASEVEIFQKINSAKNKEEFEKAIEKFSSPSQNFAFASTAGDIGMFIQGDWPIKYNGQGRFIQDGTKSVNNWSGLIPKNQMPKVVNPDWGFIASANQHSTGPDYPYYYTNENFEPYRGRYIQSLLAPNDEFTEKDMRTMQQDSYSLKAEELFELMMSPLDVNKMNDAEKLVFNRLQGWNFRYEKQLLEPVYFQEWFKLFYKKIWDELKEQTQYEKILWPSHWRTIYILRDSPDNDFFDIQATPNKEVSSDIIKMTFKEMVTKMTEVVSAEPDLNWSIYRNTKVKHLAGIDAFSSTDIYADGYRKSINAITSRTGPSWRMVVEMGKIPTAKVVYPGGQAGNPGSQYYDDFMDEWAGGEYFDALFLQSPDEGEDRVLFTQKFKTSNTK